MKTVMIYSKSVFNKFNNNNLFAKHMRCHSHFQVFIKVIKYVKSLNERFEFKYKNFNNQLWWNVRLMNATNSLQNYTFQSLIWYFFCSRKDIKKCCLQCFRFLNQCLNSSTEWISHLFKLSIFLRKHYRNLSKHFLYLHEAWWFSSKSSSQLRKCLCDIFIFIIKSHLFWWASSFVLTMLSIDIS